jgi:hypothetical protein
MLTSLLLPISASTDLSHALECEALAFEEVDAAVACVAATSQKFNAAKTIDLLISPSPKKAASEVTSVQMGEGTSLTDVFGAEGEGGGGGDGGKKKATSEGEGGRSCN